MRRSDGKTGAPACGTPLPVIGSTFGRRASTYLQQEASLETSKSGSSWIPRTATNELDSGVALGIRSSIYTLADRSYTRTWAHATERSDPGWGILDFSTSGDVFHAVAWRGTPDSMFDLHDYLPREFLWSAAYDIDELGNIIGYAEARRNRFAVVWKPVPEPGTVAALAGALGAAIRRRGIRSRRATSSPATRTTTSSTSPGPTAARTSEATTSRRCSSGAWSTEVPGGGVTSLHGPAAEVPRAVARALG